MNCPAMNCPSAHMFTTNMFQNLFEPLELLKGTLGFSEPWFESSDSARLHYRVLVVTVVHGGGLQTLLQSIVNKILT